MFRTYPELPNAPKAAPTQAQETELTNIVMVLKDEKEVCYFRNMTEAAQYLDQYKGDKSKLNISFKSAVILNNKQHLLINPVDELFAREVQYLSKGKIYTLYSTIEMTRANNESNYTYKIVFQTQFAHATQAVQVYIHQSGPYYYSFVENKAITFEAEPTNEKRVTLC